MDTKWKNYKYGTEERNPSWSFFGSAICPGCTLILLALAERGNGTSLVLGLWFLLFSVISVLHLCRAMKNGKTNLVPVEFLDKTFPDLILAVLLCVLVLNGESGWWRYSYMVNSIFGSFRYPVIFLRRFFSLFFMTGTIVLFTVVLYMSVMRHISREKLRKRLFFFQAKVLLKNKSEVFLKRWEVYRVFRAEKGIASK